MVIACFLIETYERDASPKTGKAEKELLDYKSCEMFNDYWDDAFGSFEMGDFTFQASEILFALDYQGYENEYNYFTQENE